MKPELECVRHEARWFESEQGGFEALVNAIGDARVVLIGEASHGTHEFYRTRAELTRELIARRGFNVIAVEADWPDAYRVNRWVRGASDDSSAEQALGDFVRFPRWMLRNTDVVEFTAWLRERNLRTPEAERVGFYGLDLYSLHRSIEAVLAYLGKVDPEDARRARERYSCFEMFGGDPQAYGYASTRGFSADCEDEVTAQLVDLRRRALDYANRDGRIAADEYFFAEQNARLVANAETYYRAMFGSHVQSWNVRDRHMMETLESLVQHTGRESKAVVWAHNSHLGDARHTEFAIRGELNVGQLVKQRFGDESRSIGFGTHEGTVAAADNWGGEVRVMDVRPSHADSHERLCHDSEIGAFVLPLRPDELEDGQLHRDLTESRLERAIGVIYRPETELASHYFAARLSPQFDEYIWFDRSSALQPLTGSEHAPALAASHPFAPIDV
jgi:erythromycin esterase-like protein